jgi:hypothetical protein
MSQLTSLLKTREDFQYVFMPILERVGNVLRKQLEMALDKGKMPKISCGIHSASKQNANMPTKKVFVVGGFGQCPSLFSYLREFLHDFAEEIGLPDGITLVEPVNHHDRYVSISSHIFQACC